MNYAPCEILQCEPTQVDGCWYLLAEGQLDIGPPLTAFEARVRQAINDGARWIIFDSRKLRSFLDMGYGTMVALADSLDRAGGGAIMLQVNKKARVIFTMLKLESMFHFVENMDEALAIARADRTDAPR